jgi:hypothetical protein
MELLRIKEIPYTEYDVTVDPALEQEMRRRSGRETVLRSSSKAN